MVTEPRVGTENKNNGMSASGAGSGTPGGGNRTSSGSFPASGVERRRVLIVEDDEPTRRLLAITLRRGYDVLAAADGVEGLELATSGRPDLIITDVMMPRLDGITMVRELRRRDPSRRVPIIFLTAKGGAADVAAGIGAGARHYLVKPVRLQALEEMVKSLLRRS